MTAALGLATAPEPTGAAVAGTRPAGCDAWRRALESAAAGGWFHGPLGAPSPNHDTCALEGKASPAEPGVPCESPLHAHIGGTAPGAASGLRVPGPPGAAARVAHLATHVGAPLRASEPVLSTPSRSAPSLMTAPIGGFAEVHAEPTGSSESLEAPRLRSLREHATAAVRIHVESGPEGVSVWLGLDGDPATVAARAGAILADLRSLPATHRLASVVCNGTSIYTAAAGARHRAAPPSRETSWP